MLIGKEEKYCDNKSKFKVAKRSKELFDFTQLLKLCPSVLNRSLFFKNHGY